ncbi:pyrroloquinoline-quinone synthase [Longispora fulva]|uniref:Pyrroloquinoline-quinone synthase n=1 Tax=Longispora fulva TaxID=619741 RepID=A0A8J7KQP5_9ACTN|nr:pyrroloquinoline-quinone synthase PqqC [Longispora fulva]MBG6137652.1 pyrroloquinoline-quinone synthase [Longispora fulva]GIG62189.1 pyrroloquinoline-quinone synthase [Longispora fulva]
MTEQFVAELRRRATIYWEKHPFQQAMLAGELAPDAIRAFVSNRWYYQASLPRKDAAIIANCPVPAVRRRWLERIAYHDGAAEGEGGMADWLALCDAVGLDRADVLDPEKVLPGVRFAVDRYSAFAREASWVAGVASSLTELFAPDLMGRRIEAFRTHYPWIDPAGLAYFEKRCVQAPREAGHALEVVLEYARTAEQRAACADALTLKCEVLWAMLDALDHAYRGHR